jgi:hypothetical protein
VIVLVASLVVGLSPRSRLVENVRFDGLTRHSVLIDCGSAMHPETDLTIPDGLVFRQYPCRFPSPSSAAAWAWFGTLLGACLLLMPLTLFRRPREKVTTRLSIVARIDQVIGAGLLLLVLAFAVLNLFQLNWGVKVYYGGSGLPSQGVAKIAMSFAIVLAFVAGSMLVRRLFVHRWPGLGRSSRQLLALGLVTSALVGATFVTAATFESVDDANCHAGCDR